MRRQLLPALLMTLVMTVILGGAYPAVVWGASHLGLRRQAEGSLVEHGGRVVGSDLIGQAFSEPRYFHPRPSAAGDGYDPRLSSGSNLGPNNATWLDGAVDDPATPDEDEAFDGIRQRVDAYRAENGLGTEVPVPSDAVTASASGLDPHISIANARLQAPRVARERGLPVDVVRSLVDSATEHRDLAVLGDDGVNVLRLNIALDNAAGSAEG